MAGWRRWREAPPAEVPDTGRALPLLGTEEREIFRGAGEVSRLTDDDGMFEMREEKELRRPLLLAYAWFAECDRSMSIEGPRNLREWACLEKIRSCQFVAQLSLLLMQIEFANKLILEFSEDFWAETNFMDLLLELGLNRSLAS